MCLLEIYFLTMLPLASCAFFQLGSVNLCWHLADTTERPVQKSSWSVFFSRELESEWVCVCDKICEPFAFADKAIHVFDFNLFYVWIGVLYASLSCEHTEHS